MVGSDVLVVGAGPAGTAVAALLQDAGLRVTLLERVRGVRSPVCGEYLSPGCRPLLARLGVLDELSPHGRALAGFHLHGSRRELFAAHPPDHAAPAAGMALARRHLDPALRAAAERRGAEVIAGFQATDLVWEAGRVVGVRGRQAGRDVERRARLVLGADGRHSVIARRLGTVRRHAWLDKLALVGHFEGVVRDGQASEIFIGRERYAILNPIEPGRTNVGVVINRGDFRPGAPVESQLALAVAALPGLPSRLAAARLVAPLRCLGPLAHEATALVAPGAAVLGDAAGFLDPFTGEGVHAALRSAELLARRAVPALEHAAAPVLADYVADWRREIRSTWRLCTLLQHGIRRPWLADLLLAWLAARPAALATVMALAGDLRPARPAALLRLAVQLTLPA